MSRWQFYKTELSQGSWHQIPDPGLDPKLFAPVPAGVPDPKSLILEPGPHPDSEPYPDPEFSVFQFEDPNPDPNPILLISVPEQ